MLTRQILVIAADAALRAQVEQILEGSELPIIGCQDCQTALDIQELMRGRSIIILSHATQSFTDSEMLRILALAARLPQRIPLIYLLEPFEHLTADLDAAITAQQIAVLRLPLDPIALQSALAALIPTSEHSIT